MDNDIRWIQRYSNFKKAIEQLKEFVKKSDLNRLEQQGLIQCFEYTFELAWKTAKDYLEANGYSPKTPRETIQIAFSINLISDGHVWIDALEKRSLMSHTYNEEYAEEAIRLILNEYYHILSNFFKKLSIEL